MAKRREVEEPAYPRPRDTHSLVGHLAAEESFAAAADAGRLHHAWLIGGQEGIGKATFAFRAARYLLAPPSERTGVGLGIDPTGRAARQVAAGSHPNLMTVDLEAAAQDVDRPPAKTIPIRTVRRALTFFGSTAADGGHRVCIVDAIEDLSLPGVNALLKTVEEPPVRATVLIVAHAPHRVLPTIRSRCRKLALAPLATGDVERIVGGLGLPAMPGQVERAASQSEGSVRRALALLDPDRMGLLDDVTALLSALPDAPMTRVLALAERLGDRRQEGGFELALDTVLQWASGRVRALAASGPRRLAPLAELCEKIADAAAEVETYNLDRRPFVVSMFGDLAEAVRQAA